MRYFKVIHGDVVTLLKSHGEFKNELGVVTGYDHIAYTRQPDDVLAETEISPVVIEAYDKEDAHTRSILLECDEHGQVGSDLSPKRVGRPPKAADA